MLVLEVALRWYDGVPLLPLKNFVAERVDLLNVQTANQYDPVVGWVLKANLEAADPNAPDNSPSL